MDLFSPFLLLVLPILFLIIKFLCLKAQNLPPGPHPWPIVGNIFHIGKKPHITMTHLAKIHGPLISLRLGTQLLIVGSSPAAAREILKTHDRILSARYVPKGTVPLLRPFSLLWAAGESSDKWKSLRALCRAELFSAKAIESQSNLRKGKVDEMVGYLSSKEGEVVAIGEVVFSTIFNILGGICFSQDFIDLGDDQGVATGLKGTIWRMMQLGVTPNIADFYPIFDGLDLQGLQKKASQNMQEVFGVWEIIIKDRREGIRLDAYKQEDFLDVMLSTGFSDNQINVLALELFTAGTETTTTTIEWAMAELIKNQLVMQKVREELRRKIKAGFINETEISQLPYLDACVKETLRLHPPVPFLIPHRALNTCEVMNYTIPQNSQLVVNVWSIGRDPAIWEDPLSFKPERFLDSKIDFRGQDFEFVPFGAGRRMCPGLPSATKQVSLILASLIYGFDWLLPKDEDPSKLDMNEKFGLTLQRKKALLLIPKQIK